VSTEATDAVSRGGQSQKEPRPGHLSQDLHYESFDTLSKIAKDHLGNANAYMKIYEANQDQLNNPDLIKPGQVLKVP